MLQFCERLLGRTAKLQRFQELLCGELPAESQKKVKLKQCSGRDLQRDISTSAMLYYINSIQYYVNTKSYVIYNSFSITLYNYCECKVVRIHSFIEVHNSEVIRDYFRCSNSIDSIQWFSCLDALKISFCIKYADPKKSTRTILNRVDKYRSLRNQNSSHLPQI